MTESLTSLKSWMKARVSKDTVAVPYRTNVIDAKVPENVSKLARQINVLCASRKINLKNSPPYLQGILIDTEDLVNAIFKKQTLEFLKANEYFNVFTIKFGIQCKKTIKIFKDSKEEMENENAPCRRELNKLTLVFSHLLAELKAMFKEGTFAPEFKLVKAEARDFWEKAFGKRCSSKLFLNSKSFFHEFKRFE
jgi:E3 ubiquitin-protein ligase CBL